MPLYGRRGRDVRWIPDVRVFFPGVEGICDGSYRPRVSYDGRSKAVIRLESEVPKRFATSGKEEDKQM